MMKALALVALACALVFALGCSTEEKNDGPARQDGTAVSQAAQQPMAPTPTAVVANTGSGESEITVHMQSPQGVYQTGSAVVRALSDGTTEVVVSLRPPGASAQPMHLHSGGCVASQMGPVISKLQDVVNGESRTVLDKSLAALASTQVSINVHESANNFKVYTACGEVPAMRLSVAGAAEQGYSDYSLNHE